MAHRAGQHGRRRGSRVSRDRRQSNSKPFAFTRLDTLLLIAIVLGALGLRLAYAWQLRSSPMFEHPQMDELYHDQWAQAIAAGERFVDGPYFRAPLYPAFLGTIYAILGHTYLAPRIIQAIIGSLSCGLVFLIGRRVFGRGVGAVAGFVAASYWMLIYFDGELLIPTLIVFLDLVLLWLLLRAAYAPSVSAYSLAGIVLGLSALARPNILLFGPAIVIWLVVMHRQQWRRALAYVVSVTAGCVLVVLPITVRNYVVGRDLVLIASQGGVNFYIGNNPQSNGWTAIVPGTPGDWWGGYYATIARAEQARGRKLKPSEVSGYYYGEALKFMREQPAKALGLTLLKLRLFWTRWEISNNKGIYFWVANFTPMLRLLPIGFWLVAPLGLVGLVLCWRRRGELFPLWGFVLVYMASVVMFFCTARYRMPVVPPLILLATYALFEVIATVRRPRGRKLLGGVVLLAAATTLVNVTPAGRGGDTPGQAMSCVALGNAYEQQGRLDLAVRSLREALELDPDYLMARYNLGTLLGKSGQAAEAIAELRRALTARPRLEYGETETTVAAVHNNLGNALVETDAYAEAVGHYRAAIQLYPRESQVDTWFNLGRALGLLGQHRKAVGAFTEALEINPDHINGVCGLGRALFELRRYDDALPALRRCVQSQPDSVEPLDCLSLALIQAGHYREVDELLRNALPLGNPQLITRLAFLLATCPDDELRDGTEALRYARQVCPQVETCGPEQLDALAAALAETGRFDEAAELARRALKWVRRLPESGNQELAEAIEERLKLYDSGRPYRLSQP